MDLTLKLTGKHLQFNVIREKTLIEKLLDGLPENDKVVKLISLGGFSSIGFVRYIGETVKIKHLFASTLRVGKKHLQVLDVMHDQGLLSDVTFVVGSVMRYDTSGGGQYGYYEELIRICEKNKWKFHIKANHTKLLLFDTEAGKYVLETSSNLNENPSMECFSLEKSEILYEFYKNAFSEILGETG
jgi:hypothetical protein